MKHPRHTSPLDTSHLARYGAGMETNTTTEAPNRYAELTPGQQQAVDKLVNHLASGELYDEGEKLLTALDGWATRR